MRVPPEVLSGAPKWQFPAAMLLAFCIIVAGVFSGIDTRAVATQSNRVTKVQVVVAARKIWTGERFDATNIVLEVRPIESLPEGVFNTLPNVVGKRAGVEIAKGTPVADWLLASVDDAPPPELENEIEPAIDDDIPVTRLDAQAAKEAMKH